MRVLKGSKAFGRSGNEFVHYLAKEVDDSGKMAEGESFKNILDFKQLLLRDEEAIARNLTEQLLVYATGRTRSLCGSRRSRRHS